MRIDSRPVISDVIAGIRTNPSTLRELQAFQASAFGDHLRGEISVLRVTW